MSILAGYLSEMRHIYWADSIDQLFHCVLLLSLYFFTCNYVICTHNLSNEDNKHETIYICLIKIYTITLWLILKKVIFPWVTTCGPIFKTHWCQMWLKQLRL